LLRLARKLKTITLQAGLHVERTGGIVMDRGPQRNLVTGDKEARRLRAQQQRLRADQVHRGLTHARILRDRASIHAPGRQIIRQPYSHLRLTVLICAHVRPPEGCVGEVLADLDHAQALITFTTAAAGALSLGFDVVCQGGIVILDTVHQRGGCAHAQPAALIKAAENGGSIGRQQREGRQIRQA